MIRLSGNGTSVDRGLHPPPPGPSSSSSTLSPLAPPFTVDRWVPAVANPNSLPPLPPTGAMSPYFVSTGDSVWASSSSGASRLTNLNSGLGAVETTRYYPYYAPAPDSVDGTLEKMSNYKGYVGGWSGTFDLEEGRQARASVANSSWMDSLTSCQMPLALKKRGAVDSFSTYGDSFGSWHGAHNESSLTLGHVGSERLDDSHRKIYVNKSRVPNDGSFPAELDTAAWPNEGPSYFYSPETTSVVKECDTFIPSSYDRCISQLSSCSRDLEVHYPVTTSSSRQEYASSNEGNESVLSCVLKHGNSVNKHANLHRKNDDYADYLIGVRNETSIYENPEGNESPEKMGILCDAMQRNRRTTDSSLQIKGLPSENSSALGQSIDCLQDVKFEYKVTNLSCCNASNSERAAFLPDDSIQTSLETLDHLNVAVDSPCWKGASVSRQHPFSSNEIVQPLVISVTSGSDDFVQGQRSLKIKSDIKQDGTFFCNGNGKDIDLSPVTDCAEKKSNPAKVENAKEIGQHDIRGEQIIVLNEQVNIQQGIDDHEACSNTDGPNKCLSQGKDTRVLIKAMLSLSEVLLCHYCNDNEALEECDLKLVQQIIDKLEAVILRNKKGITIGSSSRISKVEEAQPETKDPNTEMSNDEVSTDAKENKTAISSGIKFDNHDNIVKSFSTSFKVSDGMAQDPKILLYKNLWVQTEATLCSLKHDVALMKLEMGSLKHLFQAKSQVSSDGLAEPVKDHDGLNSATSTSAENPPSRSNTEVEKNHKRSISKDEEIDTSVFARYRILKGRDEVILSGSNELQQLNAIKSYVDRWKVGEMKELSPNLADVNTIEKGVLKSHNASKFTVASSKKNLTGEKLPALDHRMGSGLFLKNTVSAGVQESHLSASDGSVIQSYNPKSHGKWLFSNGSSSPSSEWEHVLKDEFIW